MNIAEKMARFRNYSSWNRNRKSYFKKKIYFNYL